MGFLTVRRLAALVAILAALASSQTSARAAIEVSASGAINAELEVTLDQLFQGEALMTLAGVKPMSLVEVKNPQRLEVLMNTAEARGWARNENIGWAFSAPKSEVGLVLIYNKKAVAHVLADAELSGLLLSHGATEIDGVAATVRWFSRIVKGPWPPARGLMPKDDVILGAFLGIPAPQIRAYLMRNASGEAAPRRFFERSTVDGFYGGTIAVFTDESELELSRIRLKAARAIQSYRSARRQGISAAQTLSQWDSIALVDVCSSLLEKK